MATSMRNLTTPQTRAPLAPKHAPAHTPEAPETEAMRSFRAAIKDACADGQLLDRLCAIGRYRGLDAGEELGDGEARDRLIFIAKGSAKLSGRERKAASNTQLRAHILGYHFAGDMISIAREENRQFFLTALGDLDLITFDAHQFLDIAQSNQAISRLIIDSTFEALHLSRNQMMHMGYKSARERVTAFLASMVQSLANEDLANTKGPIKIDLPMSRSDIGDSLGLTIETVSRQFAELRKEGMIETHGRSGLTILDPAALRGDLKPEGSANF